MPFIDAIEVKTFVNLEFETVEETRKKLQERKAYIARTTKNKGL